MTGRNLSLSITQDSDCVTWGKLVELRNKYNQIWDWLSECGAESGDRYGTAPHKEEITELPTIEGFFRLSVNTGGDYANGYTSSPGSVHFILTAGTLLDRISNPDYSYIYGPKKPFNFILFDECKNCSNFRPRTVGNAIRSISCNGVSRDLYFGFKEITIESGDTGCGNILNWGDNVAELNGHLENFEPYIEIPSPSGSNCDEFVASCCNLWDVGHYETIGYAPDGAEVRVLRYIDIFVTNLGAPAITGHLAPLIYADELEEIKSRVISDAPLFQISEQEFCDSCGPTFFTEKCASSNGKGFECGTHFTFNQLAYSDYVNGLGPDGCARCTELGFSGTICTCPWEELAMVMDFILANGCPSPCVDMCTCPSSSSGSGGSSSEIYCEDPEACNSGDTADCCYPGENEQCNTDPGGDPCDFVPI